MNRDRVAYAVEARAHDGKWILVSIWLTEEGAKRSLSHAPLAGAPRIVPYTPKKKAKAKVKP